MVLLLLFSCSAAAGMFEKRVSDIEGISNVQELALLFQRLKRSEKSWISLCQEGAQATRSCMCCTVFCLSTFLLSYCIGNSVFRDAGFIGCTCLYGIRLMTLLMGILALTSYPSSSRFLKDYENKRNEVSEKVHRVRLCCLYVLKQRKQGLVV